MKALLYRLLFQRIRVEPADFRDYRTQELRDADIYLDYARRVALNLASRERARMFRVGADPTFIPEHLLEALPSILRRQAA